MANTKRNIMYFPGNFINVKDVDSLEKFLAGEWNGDVGKDPYGNDTCEVLRKLRHANHVVFYTGIGPSIEVAFFRRSDDLENLNPLNDSWGGISKKNTIKHKVPEAFLNAKVLRLLPTWGLAIEDLENTNDPKDYNDQPVATMSGFLIKVSQNDFDVLKTHPKVTSYNILSLPKEGLTSKGLDAAKSLEVYYEMWQQNIINL